MRWGLVKSCWTVAVSRYFMGSRKIMAKLGLNESVGTPGDAKEGTQNKKSWEKKRGVVRRKGLGWRTKHRGRQRVNRWISALRRKIGQGSGLKRVGMLKSPILLYKRFHQAFASSAFFPTHTHTHTLPHCLLWCPLRLPANSTWLSPFSTTAVLCDYHIQKGSFGLDYKFAKTFIKLFNTWKW